MVVAFLLFDAVIHLANIQPVKDSMAEYGFPEYASYVMGVVMLVWLALYLTPLTAILGAVLLTGYLGGAVACNILTEQPLLSTILSPVYVGIFVWGRAVPARRPRPGDHAAGCGREHLIVDEDRRGSKGWVPRAVPRSDDGEDGHLSGRPTLVGVKKYLPAAVVDVLLVLIFAALGRRSHEEASTIGGLLTTAWPFLTGLAAAGSSRSACTGTSSIRGWRYRPA